MAESDGSNVEEISRSSSSIPALSQTHPVAVKLSIRALDLEPFLFEEQDVPPRLIAIEGTS